ncbi:ATPase family AAA domain-containing protein [Salix suchowensis]|nr:ATPase family AAA domain-containing protein [Salix suchowensis]
MEEGKQRPRSPRRVLHQGMGTEVNRDVRKNGTRVHKRHRLTRAEDSDDSLLVDELRYSSKGGADIQPLQVDESVSFDDIVTFSKVEIGSMLKYQSKRCRLPRPFMQSSA